MLLDGKPVLLLCSNNYLGLADHPRVREAAAEAAMRYGAGAGRLAADLGHHAHPPPARGAARGLQAHRGRAAVRLRATWPTPASCPALARKGEVVFSDALNHASIIDGCRLARRRDLRLRPRATWTTSRWGLEQAEGRGSLIVTDGVFSMDGDVAPLAEIVELAREHDVRVMVDEAHGTGALGPEGRGAAAAAGVEDDVDLIVGTLGKALGSYGAYVCCDRSMAKYLVNTARSFIFSTALPPPGRGGRRWPRSSCCASSRGGWRSSSATRACCARRSRPRGCRPPPGDTQILPLSSATPARRGGQRAGARAGRVRPGDPAPDRARPARRACG